MINTNSAIYLLLYCHCRLIIMVAFSIKNLAKTCIHTLWKLVQLLLFMIIVPPLINYASLKREAPLLGQHGR